MSWNASDWRIGEINDNIKVCKGLDNLRSRVDTSERYTKINMGYALLIKGVDECRVDESIECCDAK